MKYCTLHMLYNGMLECDYANEFLDITALALVADMMDIRNLETHHLITKGLSSLRNPFFKALAKRQEYQSGKPAYPFL